MIVLVLAHWLACFFHYIGIDNVENGMNSWLKTENIAEADLETRYIYSIYWAITTMVTVGYGIYFIIYK